MSSLGNGMTAFALGVYAYQQTQNASGFAFVILCLFLPSILLRPLGGVLADRFDRRLMIIIGDSGSAAGVIFILIAFMTGSADLWKIYLCVAVSSAFTALQSPAYKASVTDLLTEDQFSRAGGLIQLASSSQHLFSPLLAGLLLSFSSIKTILIIDISTFFIAVLAVLVIKKSLIPAGKHEKKRILDDLKVGWLAITANNGVFSVIMLISLVTFFIGFMQTLFAPMVLSFTDAKSLGISQSISASGMLISSLLLGIINIKNRHTKALFIGTGGAGLCLALTGLTTNMIFITAAFFLFFSALPLINTSADVLIRKNIPNDTQGRAWGIIGVLSQLGFILAYSISGFLADRIFNPLLDDDGILAPTVGKIIGTGPGRGIGLILIISGISMVIVTTAAYKAKVYEEI